MADIEKDLEIPPQGRRPRILRPDRCPAVKGCGRSFAAGAKLPQLFPGLRLYDGNLGTAQNLRRRLAQAGLLCLDEGQSAAEELPCFGLPPEKFAAYLQLASSLKY